eukprot:3189741-Rhodomonas_salina.3
MATEGNRFALSAAPWIRDVRSTSRNTRLFSRSSLALSASVAPRSATTTQPATVSTRDRCALLLPTSFCCAAC